MQGFELEAPTGEGVPVVVECPHSGLQVPPEVESTLVLDAHALRRDADLDVDGLCAEVTSVGATLLRATVSRYVVDLNRAPDDLDPLLFGMAHGRRGVPRGAVWRVTTDGSPLLRRPLQHEEVDERIARYHAPYHRALAETLETLRARHGVVLVLALHSMPSAGRVPGSEAWLRRADVVPGTRGRSSASPRLIDCVDAHFRDAGYSVRHDDPYRGGYTTGHYGRPAEGVHAIQIELNRALYLDEHSLARREDEVVRLRRELARLVSRVAAELRSLRA